MSYTRVPKSFLAWRNCTISTWMHVHFSDRAKKNVYVDTFWQVYTRLISLLSPWCCEMIAHPRFLPRRYLHLAISPAIRSKYLHFVPKMSTSGVFPFGTGLSSRWPTCVTTCVVLWMSWRNAWSSRWYRRAPGFKSLGESNMVQAPRRIRYILLFVSVLFVNNSHTSHWTCAADGGVPCFESRLTGYNFAMDRRLISRFLAKVCIRGSDLNVLAFSIAKPAGAGK